MKQKTLFIILCILLTVQVMAQDENKKDIPAKGKKQTAINHSIINNPIQPIGTDAQLMLPDYKKPEPAAAAATIISLRLKLPPRQDGSSGIFPFYKKMFFYVEGEQKQYLNFASYNLAYMALGWQPDRKLNLTGGILALKQFTNHFLYGTDRSGSRFSLNYSITDQLDVNIWGQYLTGSSINSPTDVLLPQTGTGASMVLDLGGGSQLGVGAEYQYDEKKEKWNYQSGGKLRLNF